MDDQTTAEALAAHPLGEAAGRCLLACWALDAADGGPR